MHIGIASLTLHIHACDSLKQKRSYLRPIKDRVNKKFNISISETAHHDNWQKSELTVAMVIVGDKNVFHNTIKKILDLIEDGGEIEVSDHIIDFV